MFSYYKNQGSRKAVIAALSLMVGLIAAHSATATVVLMDDFDSYVDGNLSGQGGWTATAAAATPIQVAGGVDKYAQLGPSGQDEYKAFTQTVPLTPGNSIQTKFDINVSAASANGDYFSHLSNPAGTTSIFLQRVFARSSANGFQLGLLDTSGTGNATTWGTDELSFNTDYSVEVLWNFVAGNNNDTFELKVNNSGYLTHSWTSVNAEPTDLAAANLRQGSTANAATLQVDNLMVTSIPEPGTLLTAFVGLFATLALGRRRI